MDPLTLLREHTVEKKEVRLEGDHIVFDNTRFARKAPTAYGIRAGGFYAVDALWFLLQHADTRPGEYIKACTAQGIMPVSLPDKKPVLQYLRGKVETQPAIDWAGAPTVQARRAPCVFRGAARPCDPLTRPLTTRAAGRGLGGCRANGDRGA